jgi:hypothetical protein
VALRSSGQEVRSRFRVVTQNSSMILTAAIFGPSHAAPPRNEGSY